MTAHSSQLTIIHNSPWNRREAKQLSSVLNYRALYCKQPRLKPQED